ncbi:hypothetical protein JCM10212_001425 [Sporobolomyces blumeae]
MASLKIGSLLLRTLSKPIATKIKQRAKDHEGFKSRTIAMAQFLHRAEMNLRVSLLGESPKHIRPLSESRAIESGANFLSEGFLFAVAATIIIGETYRGRVSEGKRRDAVRDSLQTHEDEIEELRERLKGLERECVDEKSRNDELVKIVEEVVVIGLKGGFGEVDPDWQRHVRIGDLATRFGTLDRVLRDEDDDERDRVDDGRQGKVETETTTTAAAAAATGGQERGGSLRRLLDESTESRGGRERATSDLTRTKEGQASRTEDADTASLGTAAPKGDDRAEKTVAKSAGSAETAPQASIDGEKRIDKQ